MEEKRLKRDEAWGHWAASVMINLSLPLLPLAVEFGIRKGEISPSNLVLAASIYSISTGVVSKSTIIFLLSLFISIFYTAMFGASLAPGMAQSTDSYFAFWTLSILFVTNALLKLKYHVIELRPYTDFSLRSE